MQTTSGFKAGGGISVSRAWGTGGVVWTPGNVKAQVHLPGYTQGPAQRKVKVGTSHVDEAGRLKHLTIELMADASSTGESLKHMLLQHEMFPHQGADIPLGRLKLSVYGTELADDSPLSSLAPTAPEVQAKLLVRRRASFSPGALSPRGASPSASSMEDGGGGSEAAGAAAAAASAGSADSSSPAPASGSLSSLVIRSMAVGGRSAVVEGLSCQMDVSELRTLVAALPMTAQAWRDDVPPAKPDPKGAPGWLASPALASALG